MKEYGAGSSRDGAAKGARLLGVRAVIAESFERIHRSNLMVELYRPTDGKIARFPVRRRIDTTTELAYFKNGGVLNHVPRNLAREAA